MPFGETFIFRANDSKWLKKVNFWKQASSTAIILENNVHTKGRLFFLFSPVRSYLISFIGVDESSIGSYFTRMSSTIKACTVKTSYSTTHPSTSVEYFSSTKGYNATQGISRKYCCNENIPLWVYIFAVSTLILSILFLIILCIRRYIHNIHPSRIGTEIEMGQYVDIEL